MEPIECSETSAISTQTPGKYPKENILHIKHGESLKSRTVTMINDLVRVIGAFNAVLHSSSSRMKNVFLHSFSQAEERFMFSLIIK
jgi:hypothetical protein